MIVGIQEQIKIFSTQNSITSSWLCLQKCYNPLGAKNNDSHLKKQAIVIFYTPNYRKCGNSNSKNDSRPWTGAFAIPKSVDFRAFAVNVKTIAPTQKLYQSGHAIWCERTAVNHRLLLDSAPGLNLTLKKPCVLCR